MVRRSLLVLLAAALVQPSMVMATETAAAPPSSYTSADPVFTLSVPPGLVWTLVVREGKKRRPLFVTKTGGVAWPLIKTYVDFRAELPEEVQLLWGTPEQLFQSKMAHDHANEQATLPDVEFLSETSRQVGGLPAYDRVYRSAASGGSYHIVYVLFPDAVITFDLNTYTTTFAEDDAEFQAILATLTPGPAATAAP